MKRIVSSLISTFLIALAASQAWCQIKTPPEYPGGEFSLSIFLANNLYYPINDETKANPISGKVYVKITIDTDGTVARAAVTKGLGPAFDNEALRVISLMPRWNPATDINDRPIRVTSEIPIPFDAPKKLLKKEEPDTNYGNISIYPRFPGTNDDFADFVQRELVVPDGYIDCGTVNVFCIVNTDGTLTEIGIPFESDSPCFKAIEDLVMKMPRWHPGLINGKPTRMSTVITIRFDR